MNKYSLKVFLVAGVMIILAGAAVNAKEVLLECTGQLRRCIQDLERPRCDEPTVEKHVIAVEGSTVKHIGDGGFLRFAASCQETETQVLCLEPVSMGSNPQYAEKGERTLNLNRVTGKLDWSYKSTFGELNRQFKEGRGRGWLNTYNAQCVLRSKKQLF